MTSKLHDLAASVSNNAINRDLGKLCKNKRTKLNHSNGALDSSTISAPSPRLPSDDKAMGDFGDDIEPSVIVNLEQSLQGDISLDDVTPTGPLSQPLMAELVGSEQSGRTNNCSSSVFNGLILNSGVGADSGNDLFFCGGVRVIVGSLSSGQLSSLCMTESSFHL